MSLETFVADAKKLPFDERVELAHRFWDEFIDGFQGWKAPPIPEQATERDRRIADFEKDPHVGIPFEQIHAEMKAKYGWK